MARNETHRDAPLSGDDVYGDRENLRRYRDNSRDEHRRFAALQNRERQNGAPFQDRLTEHDGFDRDLTASHHTYDRSATENGYAYATHRDTPPPEQVFENPRHSHDHRGRGPRMNRADKRIHEDVCEALTEHDRIDASEIEVSVQEGEVTLSGTLRSRNAKRLVTDVVDRVQGVRDVHNNIRVVDEQQWPPRANS